MATMGGLRYRRWEEERDKIVYEKKGWNNQHGVRRGGSSGGGGDDDGWVFDGSRWIRYYKGWCRVPAGDRGCVSANDKKKNDTDHGYYHQALKKGPSNYTVLQPPPRTVQWKQYYDDHQEYEDVDSKAAEYIRRNHEKFFLAAQMEYHGYC